MFSALPPEADIRHARWDVRVVPTTEVVAQSTTSSAQPSRVGGISRPSAFAVFRLTYHLGVHGSRCKHFGRCLCETFSRYCDWNHRQRPPLGCAQGGLVGRMKGEPE